MARGGGGAPASPAPARGKDRRHLYRPPPKRSPAQEGIPAGRWRARPKQQEAERAGLAHRRGQARAARRRGKRRRARGRRSWLRRRCRGSGGDGRSHGGAAAQQFEDGTRLVPLPSLPASPTNLPRSSASHGQACGGAATYAACAEVDAFVPDAKLPVPFQEHGCASYVVYYQASDHERARRWAPCYCPDLGCGAFTSPPRLFEHFHAGHPTWPVTDVSYGKPCRIAVPRSPQGLHVLVGQEDRFSTGCRPSFMDCMAAEGNQSSSLTRLGLTIPPAAFLRPTSSTTAGRQRSRNGLG
ncbi:uncharacterized protein LOC112872819 [Panicum hallii]|uniref:uncharacterized protein LOC112872819 n=1 Tax=Panicum hallii TaxID=206008 RepID=UPI000DF4EB33|nr:uncharacterized protein LOC112872819 [Panicum hallii]